MSTFFVIAIYRKVSPFLERCPSYVFHVVCKVSSFFGVTTFEEVLSFFGVATCEKIIRSSMPLSCKTALPD
ncbi:10038_t:CDS:2 [Dentiscutata erythropus]|uniref:10038_t:CDS:1 n=1 Tax=Dentiscutata erythropus TaxID=1348616 RepID=A0A9N8ZEG3_9GLOM|nr:10038_t:CDS:2 [Dentiscutata erythropus]